MVVVQQLPVLALLPSFLSCLFVGIFVLRFCSFIVGYVGF
jgi:hypothetical protein